jgi:hypothetical protein
MPDRGLKACMIARECNMLKPSVLAILHDHLGMLKVNSHWVLRMLTPLQKQCSIQFSKENLTL